MCLINRQINTKLLIFLTKIVHKKYNPYLFLISVFFVYWKCNKMNKIFTITTKNDKFLNNILIKSKKSNIDINNTIIINKNFVNSKINYVTLLVEENENKLNKRIVQVITADECNQNEIIISKILQYNLKTTKTECKIDVFKENNKRNLEFAKEIELSLIKSPIDYNNAIIDDILKEYFETPKLLYEDDIIEINFKHFGQKVFYSDNKIIDKNERIYFKCNKVFLGNNNNENTGCFCVVGKTTLKQNPNIQSFLPQKLSFSCPYGLKGYYEELEKAIKPFINQRKLKLKPIFLIEANRGSGKMILVQNLAENFGMHLYNVFNIDLIANIYAQNETKLRNLFFNAKLAAPCILTIQNFENFGKNNEGQYDQRIINSFINELNNLFENNLFPIILICCSNEKTIPIELKRIFLQIFELTAPNEQQRKEILIWLLEHYESSIKFDLDLYQIANKTHGFLFEDLKALVYYALYNFKDEIKTIILTNHHFNKALDYMQSSYKDTLGAPKVPTVQWSDVGGLNDIKDEIIKTINLPLKYPELLKRTELKRSGILLFGPPGTGKTLIAKAVATECGLCFLSIKGPELLNMYVGQSEQNVREVFEKARQASPCIIFFDELDSLAPNRGMSGDSGGVMDRVVSQLLAEMDGLNEQAVIFIIGATNRPDLIDPALLRPGRFDKLLYVGPSTDHESKKSVLAALTRKFKLSENCDLDMIVRNCPGNITGADFYGICSNAWTSAVAKIIEKTESGDLKTEDLNEGNVVVSLDDFQNAIKNIKPSVTQTDLKYFEQLKAELSTNK